MSELRKLQPSEVPGLQWLPGGQSALSGGLLRQLDVLDALFLRFADELGAARVSFPPLVSVEQLDRIAYFEAFPQLFTAAVGLEASEENLQAFTAGDVVHDGALKLTELAPVREILTPAACYPLYFSLQETELSGRAIYTVRAQCHRREREFVPLERQWSFAMREIVCLGSGEEVREFIAFCTESLDRLFRELALEIEWKTATDPFFDPKNPQALMQKVDPVKREMVCDGLAIGSTNYHRHHFGDAFDITRDGKSVESGCVAFGLERWLRVLIEQYGENSEEWPRFDEIGWPGE
ncbi:MAG: hypothetical protein KY459_13475 [Acidobacteria bacterium]|nr:hypothetical protein [Acidobacteriota bacterium]